MTKYLILIFFNFIIVQSTAQTWEEFNTSNSNLPSNNVTGLSISENGKIWISTTYGIASFDEEIQAYKLNGTGFGDNILNIWTTPEDNIWVGTEYRGLWGFDGVNSWGHYHTNSSGNGIIGFGIDSNDTIWILDKFGDFEKWNDGYWEEISDFFSQGNGLFVDSKDNIWLLSNNSGLQKYFNGQLLIHYKNNWIDKTREDYIPSVSIHDMVEDSEGNYWIGSNDGLIKFDGVLFTVYNTENSDIPSNKIRTLAIDEKNIIWIGTWDAGISKFDGTSWVNYNLTNSPLASNIINDIEIGQDGKIWIANGYNEFRSPSGGQGIFVFDEFNDNSDGILPNAPTDLSIKVISINEVKLSWLDNSDNESGFNIERSTNNNVDFKQLKFLMEDNNTFTDLSVLPDNTYYYRITARNSQGASEYSNVENIIPKYCTVNKSSYACYANVTLFQFGNIDNSIFNSRNGYYDYLDQSATVNLGQTLNMTVIFDRYSITSDPIIGGEIFIDWNGDGDFEDENELIFKNLNINGKGIYTFSVNVPENAALGVTRIRTRADNDVFNNISACGYAEETQDYSLLIDASIDIVTPTELQTNDMSSTAIRLTWRDNSSNETSHDIFRSNDGVDFEQIASVPSNIIQYLDDVLQQDTKYYYKTVARKDSQSSDFSDEVSATTLSVDFKRIIAGDFPYRDFSVGAFWGDINNDSKVDIFTSGDDQLYSNNGNTFSNSGHSFASSGSASWGDSDNDGDLDLFTTSYNYAGWRVNNFLYVNNGDGSFTETTPIETDGRVNNCVWVDLNKDGKLDLFLSYIDLDYGKTYLNMGEGNFEEHLLLDGASGFATFVDYDNDNDPDLFVAKYNYNLLYDNNEGVLEINISNAISFYPASSNGSSWGDIDNDGDMDLFVANGKNQEENNSLYINNGNGGFSKVFNSSIVNDKGRSFGSAFQDFDNDGYLDIVVANFQQQNFLYKGTGDGTFVKLQTSPIMNEYESMDSFLDKISSSACAWGDYNLDGFSDLIITNRGGVDNFLYENSGNSNNWLRLKLVGNSSNTSGIGAKLLLEADGEIQSREIFSQTGFAGQNELIVNFGLGNKTIVDKIEIRWPSGIIQKLSNIEVNQSMEIFEFENEVLKLNNEKNIAFSIFPNPFSDFILIENNDKDFLTIVLLDLRGKTLKKLTSKLELLRLDVSTLQPGFYFIKIESNQLVTTKKMVKQ